MFDPFATDDDVFSDDTEVDESSSSVDPLLSDSEVSEGDRDSQISRILSSVPSYLRPGLEQYIRENPEILGLLAPRGRAVPEHIAAFESLSSVFRTVYHSWGNASIDRAVADVLDEITEGKVTRRFLIYTHERNILMLHSILSMINQIYAGIEGCEMPPTPTSIQFTRYLLTYIDIIKFSLEDQIDQYKYRCELDGHTPDPHVIDNGMLAYTNAASDAYLPYATHSFHHLYGNVAGVPSSKIAFNDDIVKMLVLSIFA